MSKATDYLLSSIRSFLDRKPRSKASELYRLHEKMCEGRRLSAVSASRHMNLVMIPRLDTGLVYLRFAQLNGIVEACPPSEGLFRYVIEKTNVKSQKTPVKKR